MAEGGIDVLMRVVGPEGAIEAQSGTVFATMQVTDGLRDKFTPGYFCELREFSFAAGVADAQAAADNRNEADKLVEAQRKVAKQEERTRKLATLDEAGRRAFAAERLEHKQSKSGGKRLSGQDVDMQPVEFTRVMDSMSTRLFRSLVECETLKELSVVKRKATGSRNSGDCYLRLDFKHVLVTALEWKDSEHLILETGTFIYRKVTIRYRPQRADGTLGAVIQAEWEMKPPNQGR